MHVASKVTILKQTATTKTITNNVCQMIFHVLIFEYRKNFIHKDIKFIGKTE